jgi:hypothetical protein
LQVRELPRGSTIRRSTPVRIALYVTKHAELGKRPAGHAGSLRLAKPSAVPDIRQVMVETAHLGKLVVAIPPPKDDGFLAHFL